MKIATQYQRFVGRIVSMILLGLYATPINAQSNYARMLYRDSAMSFEAAAAAEMQQILLAHPADTTEGGALNGFSRWADFMAGRVCTDAPQGQDQLAPASIALRHYLQHQAAYCQNSNGYTGNWKNIGPFVNSYGGHGNSGRIDALWVDSADQGFILAGANAGGLWKTTDTGHHWTNISDNNASSLIPGTIGVYGIAVNPLNHDIIYINTGNAGADDYSWGYSTGIAYTTDGGLSWQYDTVINTAMGLSLYPDKRSNVKMEFKPNSQVLFISWKNKLYRRSFPTDTWHSIAIPGLPNDNMIADFEFCHQDPTQMVLAMVHQDSTKEIKTYSTTTGVWAGYPIPVPAGYIQLSAGQEELSLSGQDVAISTRILQDKLNNTLRYSFLYTDLSTGASKEVVQGSALVLPQYFEVSQTNPALIYGTVHDGWYSFVQSIDSGQTFTYISGNAHADGRCIKLYRSTNTANGIGDIVFAGTDGGIARKNVGNSTFQSIVGDGLCITQFYGFGSSEDNEGMLGGGAQDNSVFSYIKDRSPQWYGGILGGDGYKSKFTRKGVKTMYTEINFPGVGVVDFSKTATPGSQIVPPNDHIDLQYFSPVANKARPLYIDPDNVAHIGVNSLWRQHIGDADWYQLFQPEPKPSNDSEFYSVLKFDLPEKAGFENIAYVGYKGQGTDGLDHNPTKSGTNPSLGRLYVANNVAKSSDLNIPHSVGGITPWQNITPSAVGWYRMTDFTTDPENPARIWVTLGDIKYNNSAANPQTQTGRVYYSDNYGTDWQDVSRGLPPLPVDKIVYQQGTDDILYVGTDVGVFVWNKADSQWCQFNTGLPPCIVTDMEINYCEGKLRVATFGRGIWECDIMNESNNNNPVVGDFVPKQTTVISTNTTWSSDKTIYTGIRILSGAKLTINNTAGAAQTVINMPKNGAIGD